MEDGCISFDDSLIIGISFEQVVITLENDFRCDAWSAATLDLTVVESSSIPSLCTIQILSEDFTRSATKRGLAHMAGPLWMRLTLLAD